MREMGSSKNIVANHLLVLFALHAHFINESRPVPRFLFLDQPSVGCYGNEERGRRAGPEMQELDDPDRQQVRRIFSWIFDRVRAWAPRFQVIITEHVNMAQNSDFREATVEDWWNDGPLVPRHWYQT